MWGQNRTVFGRILVVLSCIYVVAAFTLPDQSYADSGLSDLLTPIDDIEDMDTIFETYERQYSSSNNDNFAAADQLLVEASHIISSRASDPDTLVEASGSGQPNDEITIVDAVATVRGVVEDMGGRLDDQQPPPIVVSPVNASTVDRENRTLIVVVTTNVINNRDKGSVESNKLQHSQLSFGLQDLIPVLPTAAPQPHLELHNRITTEFFNAAYAEHGITTSGVARSPLEPQNDIKTEPKQEDKQASTDVPIPIATHVAATLAVINNASPDRSTELPITESSSFLDHPSNEPFNFGIDSFKPNAPDDRIPDIIESIPQEEVREKFIQDIPREEHVPMVSKVENPLGIQHAADTRHRGEISEYVVDELPIDETAERVPEAIIIDVDNVVPDRCKVLVDDVVYGTKACFNDTDKNAFSRISRQLSDLRDDQLTFREREILEPSRRAESFAAARQMVPRIPGFGTTNHFEDLRFVNFLHTYLQQYTGRNYMDTEDTRERADRLLDRKHELENVRVSTIRDMSEYIEKTTYFNFPNHSSRVPEYVLSGDREKDQLKLDRLVYNRRFASELWRRALDEDANEDHTPSAVDLSAISIDQLRNNNTDFVVELSATMDVQKEIKLVRNKEGTAGLKDTLLVFRDNLNEEAGKWRGRAPDIWTRGDDKIPYYKMTAEERHDVEFAAYLHALIDARQDILPRIAYYIDLENQGPESYRRRLEAALNGTEAEVDRESRSLSVKSAPSNVVVDNIGSPAAMLVMNSRFDDGITFVQPEVIGANESNVVVTTEYVLDVTTSISEDIRTEEIIAAIEIESRSALVGVPSTVVVDPETFVETLSTTTLESVSVTNSDLYPLPTATIVQEVANQPGSSDNIVHHVEALAVIGENQAPLTFPTSQKEITPEIISSQDESIEIVQPTSPLATKPLQLLTGEFLVVGTKSTLKPKILKRVLEAYQPPSTIDGSNSNIVDPILCNSPAADDIVKAVDHEGSGSERDTNPIVPPVTELPATTLNALNVPKISPADTVNQPENDLPILHKIIKKNGAIELDVDSSEESHEMARTIVERDNADDDNDEDTKSTSTADLIRSVVDAVELSSELNKTMENFRNSLQKGGAIGQAISQIAEPADTVALPGEMYPHVAAEQRNDHTHTARTFNFEAATTQYYVLSGLIVILMVSLLVALAFVGLRSWHRYEVVIVAATEGTV